MHQATIQMLEIVSGPVFRFAFALMLLGLGRKILLIASDLVAAYMTVNDSGQFWRRLRLHLTWALFPTLLLRRFRPTMGTIEFGYHVVLCLLSVIFRACVIIVPVFMIAHVYLWEQSLGVSWPFLSTDTADALSAITIVTGCLAFLGRLYSRFLREIEPVWSFAKPFILLFPFVSGMLAMHPAWNPVDYHVMQLIHVLSAAVVFVLIPFARLLACVHTPLSRLMPEAAWDFDPNSNATSPTVGGQESADEA